MKDVKMMKHYLNLERETQLRNYDGMVAHITIAMSRYIFLSFEQRILSLAMEKIRSTGIVAEDIALSLVDSIMSIAIDMILDTIYGLNCDFGLKLVRMCPSFSFHLHPLLIPVLECKFHLRGWS